MELETLECRQAPTPIPLGPGLVGPALAYQGPTITLEVGVLAQTPVGRRIYLRGIVTDPQPILLPVTLDVLGQHLQTLTGRAGAYYVETVVPTGLAGWASAYAIDYQGQMTNVAYAYLDA